MFLRQGRAPAFSSKCTTQEITPKRPGKRGPQALYESGVGPATESFSGCGIDGNVAGILPAQMPTGFAGEKNIQETQRLPRRLLTNPRLSGLKDNQDQFFCSATFFSHTLTAREQRKTGRGGSECDLQRYRPRKVKQRTPEPEIILRGV